MRAAAILTLAAIATGTTPAEASRSTQRSLNTRQVLFICQHFFRTCANIRNRRNIYTADCTKSFYTFDTDRGHRAVALRNCG